MIKKIFIKLASWYRFIIQFDKFINCLITIRNLLKRFTYMINKYLIRAFFQTSKAVRFTFDEIQDCNSNLNEKIEIAYGSKGLGLAIVSGIPNYSKMRHQLLPLA